MKNVLFVALFGLLMVGCNKEKCYDCPRGYTGKDCTEEVIPYNVHIKAIYSPKAVSIFFPDGEKMQDLEGVDTYVWEFTPDYALTIKRGNDTEVFLPYEAGTGFPIERKILVGDAEVTFTTVYYW